MIELFNTPINTPALIILTVIYLITSSITVFDIRMIQAKRDGRLPDDEPMLPTWVGLIAWLDWIVFIFIILLNWRYAIIIFLIKFILKVLPVLETIGNILMSPFKARKK